MAVALDQFFLYTIPTLFFFVDDQQLKSLVIQASVIIHLFFQALLRSRAFFLYYNTKYYNCQIRAAEVQPCKPYEIRKISKQLAASRISSGARACAPNQTTGAYGHMGLELGVRGQALSGLCRMHKNFGFQVKKFVQIYG